MQVMFGGNNIQRDITALQRQVPDVLVRTFCSLVLVLGSNVVCFWFVDHTVKVHSSVTS